MDAKTAINAIRSCLLFVLVFLGLTIGKIVLFTWAFFASLFVSDPLKIIKLFWLQVCLAVFCAIRKHFLIGLRDVAVLAWCYTVAFWLSIIALFVLYCKPSFPTYVQQGLYGAVIFLIILLEFIGNKLYWQCIKSGKDPFFTSYISKLSERDLAQSRYWLLNIAIHTHNTNAVKILLNEKYPINDGTLGLAAENRDNEVVKMLLENGADPNFVCKNRYLPLYYALVDGNENTIDVLLKHGASLDLVLKETADVLQKVIKNNAITTGKNNIVEMLLEHGAAPNSTDKYDYTPIETAIHESKEDIVKTLLEHGANPNIVKKDDTSLLYIGVLLGNTEIVKMLLEHGANPNQANQKGEIPLHALNNRKSKPSIAKLLLDKGSEVNKINNKGETPLDVAFDSEIKALLRFYGAKTGDELKQENSTDFPRVQQKQFLQSATSMQENLAETQKGPKQSPVTFTGNSLAVNAPDQFGETPLLKAVKKGQVEKVKDLIAQGADVNFVDQFKSSVLMTAVKKENAEIVKLLVEAGADVNYKNNFGKSVLQVAEQKGFTEIISLLKSAGAKE